MVALHYTTLRDQRLARTAGPVLAPIGQHDARIQRGFQHRGLGIHLELLAAG